MIHLTENTINDYISGDKPVLVDFYAEWCTPCMKLAEIFHRVEEPFKDKIVFGKINIDEQRDFAIKNEVRAVPTFLLYNKGELVEKWVGIKTIHEIKTILEKYVT